MEQISIPQKRFEMIDRAFIKRLEEELKCKIAKGEDNELTIEGEAYDEYNAKAVIEAFGRGFDMRVARKLLNEDYFMKSISLKELFKNREQVRRIKARLIGSDGKTKTYIEEVSGSDLAVYGSRISMIGTIQEIDIAMAAVQVLINGGTHKKAYKLMENERRKSREGGYNVGI